MKNYEVILVEGFKSSDELAKELESTINRSSYYDYTLETAYGSQMSPWLFHRFFLEDKVGRDTKNLCKEIGVRHVQFY